MFEPEGINDTSPEAEMVMLGIYRKMSACRKFELIAEAQQMSKVLALVGLRARHPEDSPAVLERRYFDLTLGEELAERVYGPVLGSASSLSPDSKGSDDTGSDSNASGSDSR